MPKKIRSRLHDMIKPVVVHDVQIAFPKRHANGLLETRMHAIQPAGVSRLNASNGPAVEIAAIDWCACPYSGWMVSVPSFGAVGDLVAVGRGVAHCNIAQHV